MNSNSTVSAELGLRLIVPQETVVPLVARLCYTAEDPYAIRVAFHVGLEEPVEWIFARELLAAGIDGQQGDGDVRVWPSSGVQGDLVLNLELSSPYGQAHFEAPAGEVSDVLRRTYQVVPTGRESGHLDLEGELADLLREAF
jgi:hypothetical protein